MLKNFPMLARQILQFNQVSRSRSSNTHYVELPSNLQDVSKSEGISAYKPSENSGTRTISNYQQFLDISVPILRLNGSSTLHEALRRSNKAKDFSSPALADFSNFPQNNIDMGHTDPPTDHKPHRLMDVLDFSTFGPCAYPCLERHHDTLSRGNTPLPHDPSKYRTITTTY